MEQSDLILMISEYYNITCITLQRDELKIGLILPLLELCQSKLQMLSEANLISMDAEGELVSTGASDASRRGIYHSGLLKPKFSSDNHRNLTYCVLP